MILSYDRILKNFMRTNREQRTDREQTENRQRIQNLRPLLSPWIVGVSGPINKEIPKTLQLFRLNQLIMVHIKIVYSKSIFLQQIIYSIPYITNNLYLLKYSNICISVLSYTVLHCPPLTVVVYL